MSVKFIKSSDGYYKEMCPVSTVRLDGFSPNKISKKISYANDIHENSEYYNRIIPLEPTWEGADESTTPSGFPMTYYESTLRYKSKFFISDKINDRNEPLFYVYELKFDVTGVSDNEIIEVVRNNDTPLPPERYKIQFGDVTLTDNYYGAKDTNYDRYGRSVVWGNIDNTKNIHRVRILLPLSLFNRDDFYVVRYNKSVFNVSYPNHIELLELEELYNETADWTVDDGTIRIPDTSKLKIETLNELYIVKDPNAQIRDDGIISMNSDGYQTDADSSWHVRINHGSFLTNIDKKFYQTRFVPQDLTDPQEKYHLITYVNPKLLGGNIVKVEETPIHVSTQDDTGAPSGYVYPYYDIDIFPKESFDNVIPVGTFGIDVDSIDISRIKISSIDRKKGYVLFNRQFNPQDEVDLFFYTNCDDRSYVYNLELNPRLEGDYGIGNNATNTYFNIGLAVRESPAAGVSYDYTQRLLYYSIYFFNYDDVDDTGNVDFVRGNQIPGLANSTVNGTLKWNPYNGKADATNGTFIPISHISVNRLYPDILDIRDARVINGGLNNNELKLLKNEQTNSYTDIGYYDGEPLPHAGLVIIHLPSGIYPNLVERWKASDMFNPDMYTDITRQEIERLAAESGEDYEEYYAKLLNGESVTGDNIKDPYDEMHTRWAKKEASHYLDQLIKKYIPAGTQYVLLDDAFNQIRLDV